MTGVEKILGYVAGTKDSLGFIRNYLTFIVGSFIIAVKL